MVLIAILGPACISILFRYRHKKHDDMWKIVMEYGIYVLTIAFLTQSFITYVIGTDGVTQEALESFPFFTKYVFFSIIIALVLPFLQALIEKYIKITVEVGVYDRTEEDEEKKDY